MSFPFFNGTAKQPPQVPVDLPVPDRERLRNPAAYIADATLVDAVNVALLLSQPLLLTGEPGTGKTELAHRLAWELGLGEPLIFNTKTTSTARDLFYTFDAMGRFQVAHTGKGSDNNLHYITYNALGLAILRSREQAAVQNFLAPGSEHGGRRQSVVLVDEIDKAPRDFPNDLLHEVDHLSFRIAELGNAEVRADPSLRPILVLTSNSEKNLPDAFLRRCVFYNIPLPGTDRLIEIVRARVAALGGRTPTAAGRGDGPGVAAEPLVGSAVQLFQEIRSAGLRKPPSTAELLNWVQTLIARGAVVSQPVAAIGQTLLSTTCVLAKTRDDADSLERFMKKKFNF
jgi:MoxR-like ATPase